MSFRIYKLSGMENNGDVLILRRLGIKAGPSEAGSVLSELRKDPAMDKEIEKYKNTETMINEDKFLEVKLHSFRRSAYLIRASLISKTTSLSSNIAMAPSRSEQSAQKTSSR